MNTPPPIAAPIMTGIPTSETVVVGAEKGSLTSCVGLIGGVVVPVKRFIII